MAVKTEKLPTSNVIVHPLVLLSVVDHFNRMGKIGNQRRVVGALLGSWKGRDTLDISNSFAVPFEEDDRDASIWFLDHDYLENMYDMFKKVNAKEKIVGWYHTGLKLQPNDILINEVIKKYAPNCVMAIIDVNPKDYGLPAEIYRAVDEITEDESVADNKTFIHIASEMGAEEAEEVGVEHLLRDINDTTIGTLGQRIAGQLNGLGGLQLKLTEIRDYMQKVSLGHVPMNNQIFYQILQILNMLPNIATQDFVDSLNVKTNDKSMILYITSLMRAIIAMNNLIDNKISNHEAEKKENRKKNDEPKNEKKEKFKGEKEIEKEKKDK